MVTEANKDVNGTVYKPENEIVLQSEQVEQTENQDNSHMV